MPPFSDDWVSQYVLWDYADSVGGCLCCGDGADSEATPEQAAAIARFGLLCGRTPTTPQSFWPPWLLVELGRTRAVAYQSLMTARSGYADFFKAHDVPFRKWLRRRLLADAGTLCCSASVSCHCARDAVMACAPSPFAACLSALLQQLINIGAKSPCESPNALGDPAETWIDSHLGPVEACNDQGRHDLFFNPGDSNDSDQSGRLGINWYVDHNAECNAEALDGGEHFVTFCKLRLGASASASLFPSQAPESVADSSELSVHETDRRLLRVIICRVILDDMISLYRIQLADRSVPSEEDLASPLQLLSAMPDRRTIPVTILTGYLGAGKTTLLNHWLRNNQGVRIAVMVNDLGQINIDSHLLASPAQDESMVTVAGNSTAAASKPLASIKLSNGCICCTIADSFVDSLLNLVAECQASAMDHIIVETSGVSDASSIVALLSGNSGGAMSASLSKFIALEQVITVVDAANASAGLLPGFSFGLSQGCTDGVEDSFIFRVFDSQIASADIIYLTKCDLVDDQAVDDVELELQLRCPVARIFRPTVELSPPPLFTSLVLNGGMHEARVSPLSKRAKSNLLHPSPHKIEVADGMKAVSANHSGALSREKFELIGIPALMKLAYRSKGILWMDSEHPQCVIFHHAGGWHTMETQVWPPSLAEGCSNHLVVIGTASDVCEHDVADILQSVAIK